MDTFRALVEKLDFLKDDELKALFNNIVYSYSSQHSRNQSESSKALLKKFEDFSSLLEKREALKGYLLCEHGGAFYNDGKKLFLSAKAVIETHLAYGENYLKGREPRVIKEEDYIHCALQQAKKIVFLDSTSKQKSKGFTCFNCVTEKVSKPMEITGEMPNGDSRSIIVEGSNLGQLCSRFGGAKSKKVKVMVGDVCFTKEACFAGVDQTDHFEQKGFCCILKGKMERVFKHVHKVVTDLFSFKPAAQALLPTVPTESDLERPHKKARFN